MDGTLQTESRPASSKWVAGRIQTLLSHYFQPDTPSDVTEAALVDWVKSLAGFSAEQIEAGCQSYIRSQPRNRPTPADLRNMIGRGHQQSAQRGSKESLSMDERHILETQILPTARRWLDLPGLRSHGESTLAYWGSA